LTTALTTAPHQGADTWTVHCDGSAVPNPGRMAWGVVMSDPQGHKHLLSHATHLTGCNNEAELRALMAALRELQQRQAAKLRIFSDNSIVVEQLTVPGCKPVARLSALFDDVRAMLSSFEQATLQWIPRHRNGEADALARAAQGLPLASEVAKPSKRQRRKA